MFGGRLRSYGRRDTVPAASPRSPLRRLYRRAIRPAGREILLAARRAIPVRRMEPGFLIVGAKKAGTTSLYYYLTTHPRIASALSKEVGFFGQRYHRSVGWYRGHFPVATPRRESEGWFTGEATPYYLVHPLAPERAAHHVPHARLIVLLRDPVLRAYSHYQHSIGGGREPLSFEDALEREESRLAEASAAGGGPTSPEAIFALRVYAYRATGIYERYIRRWLEHFPREQMLVLETERLERSLEPSLGTVTDFLGVEPLTLETRPHLNVRRYPPIPEGPGSELRDFYRPHNARLRELLDQDFSWAD